MRFQHVAFLSSRVGFVVEAKASGPPHIFKLWLWVGKGMLPVTYFYAKKTSFCVS